MEPRITVTIPAYNVEAYIRQALTSALAQTEHALEILIVDDASTDGTVSAIREFDDPRIRLLLNEENHGPSYTLNRAFTEARGEWIALLDADDWYAEERLERLLAVAEQYQADLVVDDLQIVMENGRPSYNTIREYYQSLGMQWDTLRAIDLYDFMRIDCGLLQPLIRRAFLETHHIRFMEEMRFAEDFMFFFHCLHAGAVMMAVPEGYYYYRSREGSLTNGPALQYPSCDVLYFEEYLHTPSVQHDPTLARAIHDFIRLRDNQFVR